MSNKETHLQTLALQAKNDKDEKITELLYQLSTYEYHLDKMSTNKKQIKPMSLHITEISSRLSAYENRLDNMRFKNIYKFET